MINESHIWYMILFRASGIIWGEGSNIISNTEVSTQQLGSLENYSHVLIF